ncbi:MAG TPA: DegT/DnrJ/EryC1/StrS family aminotransferase [Solirubrobacteraceae bacterium]|nr:DegT/DnrJ/EryC1/StrS family aminotransferase [Solirubrobacteraceae bacterium]
MPHWQVPLADVVVTDEDIGVISDVYRSGWLSMGPRTEELEARLAGYVGARHAVAVSSGTAALHLMCLAAGFGPGDEVIVPSMTFVATANAVAYTGARPVFADVISLTEPWLSVDAVRALITDRTRGVMAMSYGGHPGQIAELVALCAERDIVLLEDAAHGLGSRLGERHVGTFGKAGAFSFFSNKNLAVGEGGAIVTDDDDFDRRLRLLRSHGMTTLTWDRHRGHASGYDVVALGFNYRIDEPRAALAAARLERLDAENHERARLDATYRQRLGALPLACALPTADPVRSAHHLFCVVLDEGQDRDAFRARLVDAQIQTSIHYPPVHRFSIYGEQPSLPVTEAYAQRTVTLPMFAHMTEAQQDLVIEAVAAAVTEPTAQTR